MGVDSVVSVPRAVEGQDWTTFPIHVGITALNQLLLSQLLILLLGGCMTLRQDGLYEKHRLVIVNATVEQFAQEKIDAQLIRGNKEVMSK